MMLCMPQCKNISREHDRLEVIDSHSSLHPTLTISSLKSKDTVSQRDFVLQNQQDCMQDSVQARDLSDKDPIL